MVIDKAGKYVIKKLESYLEGYNKERAIWQKELDEEKLFDKSVANAMANENIEMSIKKNT